MAQEKLHVPSGEELNCGIAQQPNGAYVLSETEYQQKDRNVHLSEGKGPGKAELFR